MISVIIPTYKKKEQLIVNLKNNLPHLKGCEVIVVNDDPTDNLREDLRRFADLVLLQNEKNLGFSGAVNRGIKTATYPYVFLLNSDVLLHDDSYKKIITRFENDPKLFAAVLAQKEIDNVLGGKNRIFWEVGMIHHARVTVPSSGITAWAEGGSSIFRKSMLLELNEFDMVYSPFYWEDIDLSYRAWKAGYSIWFERDSIVTHHHESTIGTFFSRERIKTISYRNQFIFIWKNISDPKLMRSHILLLPRNLAHAVVHGEFAFINGLLSAIIRLPYILSVRGKLKKQEKKSDKEILKLFS